jgi:hypothetical protein
MRSDPKHTRVFDKENPSLSAKDALSLLRAPLAPEGQPDSPSTLQAHEAAVAKRFAATPTLPARRAPLTPKSPNPAARTPVTPAAGFSRTTEDFDLSFNSAGAGSTPGTALSQNKKSAIAGDSAEPSPSLRGVAAPRRRPSPVLESSPTAFHARMGRDADFDEAQSTGGAFSPTVRNAVNAASIVLAAAATTPGNKVTHPTPANTPAARAFPLAAAVRREEEGVETDVETDVEEDVEMNVEKTDVSENQSSPSEEAVIEEVRSWFASVHSKLDVALSAISPAPARATSVSPPYGSTRTPARAPTLPGSSAGLTSTPVEALSVFPRAASGVMYPTPALASADDLRDEARRAAKALADAAIAALTEREEARDAPVPVPNAPGLDSGIEAVVAPEAPEVVEAVVPETPNEHELADREEVATPEPKRAAASAASVASNENHLDARCLSTPPRAPPLVSPPPSSPAVGHAAHDALAMTPETLRVVAMVTCAALLSGYTIAITVFSLATVMNAAAAAAAAAWRAVAVWGARGPAPAEAVRCVMRGAFSIYPPGLARLVLAAEAALGDALDALRGAGGAGASEGVPESYGAFESPTAFEDSRIVTLTWEGVALLFFVVTTATLVAGGAALFFAGADGDALETLATAVSPGTRRVLSRVMEAVSPVSPAGSGRERARLRSTFF